MTISELRQRLQAAGCSSANYHLGEPHQVTDVYCLALRNGRWHVFYTERGNDSPPEKIFNNETEACQFFHDFVMRMRHLHLVGFYQSSEAFQQHMLFLQQQGFTTVSDQIPYGGWEDPRYRLFVEGLEIFAVQQLLPTLPLNDQSELPHAD